MLPNTIKKRLFSEVSMRTLRYVHPIPPARATGLLSDVCEQIDDDFVLGGPLVVHSQTPVLMAGMWMAGREINLVTTALDRPEKEAIAAAVAVTNRCPYCVDLHTTLTHAAERHEVAAAIRTQGTVDDPHWDAVIEWGLATRTPDAFILRDPPFGVDALPEAIGNAVFFNYVNRVVNVLFDGSALGKGDGFAKGVMLRTFGAELRHQLRRPLDPGVSVDLLPEADLPPDLAWAEGQPVVADALARWAASLEMDTDLALSPRAKAHVQRVVEGWDGEDPPLGRGWVTPHLQAVDPEERPPLRLALLTALDSHRVLESDVQEVLDGFDDETLIRTVAFGAFTAARRVGKWLVP